MMKSLRTEYIGNRVGQGLRGYVRQVAKTRLLSDDEQSDLAKRIRMGDRRALDILVQANLRFVVYIAKNYENLNMDLSDLISEGNLGLICAAKKFDETRGFKFMSYAEWWIRKYIMQALSEHSRTIRLPTSRLTAYKKITKAIQCFEHEHHREPDVEELAEILDMTKEAIEGYLMANASTCFTESLNGVMEDGELRDTVYDKNERSAEDSLMALTAQDELARVLSKLNPRESEVISNYFGLNGKEPVSLEDIGHNFGYPTDKVRQIKENSIRKLQAATRGHLMEVYAA